MSFRVGQKQQFHHIFFIFFVLFVAIPSCGEYYPPIKTMSLRLYIGIESVM